MYGIGRAQQVLMTTQLEMHRTQRLERAAQRVMDSLDRQDERLNLHYSTQRKQERHELRTMAVVVLPAIAVPAENPPASVAAAQPPAVAIEPQRIDVWVRNVSPNGLSFIYPQEFPHKKLIVGLNPSPAATAWFHAEVMRVRKALDGFWEYGVAFRERAAL